MKSVIAGLLLASSLLFAAGCVKPPAPWDADLLAGGSADQSGDHRGADWGAELAQPDGDSPLDLAIPDGDSVADFADAPETPDVDVTELPPDLLEDSVADSLDDTATDSSDTTADLAFPDAEIEDLQPEIACEQACVDRCGDGGTDGICECPACDDGNPCTSDSCNQETAECTYDALAANGMECDADGDGCTVNDVCTDGICLAGAPAVCDNLDDACLTGTCLSTAWNTYDCQPQPVAPGTACDDGNFCTVAETCNAEAECAGGKPNTCGMDYGPCQTVSCNVFSEECKLQSLADGETCDDENPCTFLDTCESGQCVGKQDLCLPRAVSTTTTLAGDVDESGPASLIDVGAGRGLALWKSGTNRLSGRYVDADLSLSYPERVYLDNWMPSETDCQTSLAGHATAARADGDWLLAITQKAVRVWLSDAEYTCNAAWTTRFSLAAFDAAGDSLLPVTQVPSQFNLWFENWSSSGGKIYSYECGCQSYPDNFTGGIDITFPSLAEAPPAGVAAAAYADGTFAVAYWEAAGNQGYYLPVGADFAVLPAIALGSAINVQMCVSPVSDVALLVFADGEGGLAGRFLDHADGDVLSDPFDVTVVEPGNLVGGTCAGLDDGSFVVTVSNCPVPYDCDTTLQLISPEGTFEGSDTPLHQDDSGEQLVVSGPVVYPDGRYVVVYHDDPFGGLQPDIMQRIFSGELLPQTAEQLFSANENVANFMPVARLVGGRLMAVWWRTFGGLTDVVFRQVQTDGLPVLGAPERVANGVTQGIQSSGSGVELPEAEFALVWAAEGLVGGMGLDIALRRFGPDGAPLGPETRVNTSIVGDQEDPRIAYHALADTVLVTWTHEAGDGSTDIRGRLLAADGTVKSDEFLVSMATVDPENEFRSSPIFLDDGSFVVSYTGWGGTYHEDIFAQFFANNGTKLDVPGVPSMGNGKVRMNYVRKDRQDHGELVAVPGTKAFVSASAMYAESNWAPMEVSVRKLTLTVDGESGLWTLLPTPQTGDVTVSTSGNPEDPTMVSDGTRLLVCWKSNNFIRCQPLTYDLAFAGSAFTMETLGYAENPVVAARDTGHFVLAYDQTPEAGDGDFRGIVLHRFDAEGEKLAASVLANTTVAGSQYRPFVVPLTLADMVGVGWTGGGQDGSGDGIVFRLLD